MTSVADLAGGWFAFLDERLRSAVVAAAASDGDPGDALRGLYISDEQALAMAGDLASPGAERLLASAVDRLRLDALDAAVLTVCSAPELHPRYGRLFAYLQDDVTRKLPSPRLVASLLAGDGVDPADVLACFTPDAAVMRSGAIRLLTPDAATALADRPVKLADRLAAFLLGASRLADAAAGFQLRRAAPHPSVGRTDVVAHVALLLSAETRLPLVVCGPDAAMVVAGRRKLECCCWARASSTARMRSPTPASPRRSSRAWCAWTVSTTSPPPNARASYGLSTRPRSGRSWSRTRDGRRWRSAIARRSWSRSPTPASPSASTPGQS
jgi:hypothetical protein